MCHFSNYPIYCTWKDILPILHINNLCSTEWSMSTLHSMATTACLLAAILPYSPLFLFCLLCKMIWKFRLFSFLPMMTYIKISIFRLEYMYLHCINNGVTAMKIHNWHKWDMGFLFWCLLKRMMVNMSWRNIGSASAAAMMQHHEILH